MEDALAPRLAGPSWHGTGVTDPTASAFNLTHREVEVLTQLANGFTARAIADYLRISELTCGCGGKDCRRQYHR